MKRSLRDLLSEERITIELDLGEDVEVDASEVVATVAEAEDEAEDAEGAEDEEAEGEHSTTSKAQYDDNTNIIYIYYPNKAKKILQSMTNSMQLRTKKRQKSWSPKKISFLRSTEMISKLLFLKWSLK